MSCLEWTLVSAFLLHFVAGTPDTIPNLKMIATRVSLEAVKLSCLISGGQVQHLEFQRKYSAGDELVTIAGISIINKTCEYKSADKVLCLCLTANEVICIVLVHRNETEHSWKCSSLLNGHLFGSNIVNASVDENTVVNNNTDSSNTEHTTTSTQTQLSPDSGIVLICVASVILLGVVIGAVRHRRSLRYLFKHARNGFGNNETFQSPTTSRRGSVPVNVYNTYSFAKSLDDEPQILAEPSQKQVCQSLPRGIRSEIYSVACIEHIGSVSSTEGEQNDDQDAGYAEIEYNLKTK
ncbi:uncharacterized protein LOC127848124 isoform X2 [Dreissena polymorpha]|uniref:uncharacterized protein LOC127848124 isoform X2 n=1 Tax=Dreissena polymorpha TaxID=45954 RepID=UPI002263CCC3|nr:uncharacterized protein LOC127848124 isoform X2 [Dreissena polymorpha]